MTAALRQPEASPSAALAGALSQMDAATLALSQTYCQELTRRKARNFYYGLKLLGQPKRSAMYALYGYMRLADDIADDDSHGRTMADRHAALDRWSELTHQAIDAAAGKGDPPRDHVLWPAFTEMIRQHRIPARIFDDMIAGQRQDLEPLTMPDFAALHQYCYRVASVVGVASLYVFGFEGGDETLALGADRGIAFQLTNILRDLHEDARPPRQRCYLPEEDLTRFAVSREALAEGKGGAAFDAMMRFQIERARSFYDRSAALDRRVRGDARPTLSTMTAIYRGLLEKIASNPERVLTGRVRLSSWSKFMIGWRAMRGARR